MPATRECEAGQAADHECRAKGPQLPATKDQLKKGAEARVPGGIGRAIRCALEAFRTDDGFSFSISFSNR
jgi:hypothetical protein